jgi:hypothetical protein
MKKSGTSLEGRFWAAWWHIAPKSSPKPSKNRLLGGKFNAKFCHSRKMRWLQGW